MPKRQLADRILDEILTLRRPRSVVVELDGSRMDKPASGNRARTGSEETVPAVSARGQLIVE
jgi:hypothetical protein